MKYLAALLLSGCAYLHGPCYFVIDLTEKFAICEVGGTLIIMPSNVLEIDSDSINFKK